MSTIAERLGYTDGHQERRRKIIDKYASRDCYGYVMFCTPAHGKVRYPDQTAAESALTELNAIPYVTPATAYTCRGHWHLSSQSEDQ